MSRRTKLLLSIFVALVFAGAAACGFACWQSREPFRVRYVEQYFDATHGEERRIIALEVKNTSRTPIHCLHAMITSGTPLRPGEERLPYMHWEYSTGEEYPGIWTFAELETLYNRYRNPHPLGPIMPGETRRVELHLEEVNVKRLPLDGLVLRYEWVPMLRVQYWDCREWIRINFLDGRFPSRSLHELGFTRTTNCPAEIPLPPWNTLTTKPGAIPNMSPAP
jgi:hypothetical protein